jgi:hypothetical protein
MRTSRWVLIALCTSVLVACGANPPAAEAAPAIVAQPLPATILRGGSASFSVTTSGTAPLAYQWRHDGVAIPGANLATYDLLAATTADAGNYSVVVSNAAGTVNSADALLTVLLPTFTIGGSVTGLTGTGLVLQDNGADAFAISADGSFTFATPVADGSPYAVTVAIQPTGQACSVTSGAGTVARAAVTTVAVTCGAVAAPVLSSIAITPAALDLVAGNSGALAATGTYSDASTAILTTSVTWNSTQPTIASVGPSTGVVSGLLAGTASITASLGGTTSPAVIVTVRARALNDTGISYGQCYQVGSYVLGACDSGSVLAVVLQDGQVGRDATLATNGSGDGKLGFSFTAVTGGCVQDNVTGLMWEVKTADAVPGLRDWLKAYSNYSPANDPGGPFGYGKAGDATGFKNAVNANTLCGFNDWRLPTANELQSLVDYGEAGAGGLAIDTTWFPNIHPARSGFWAAEPDVSAFSNFPPSGAWFVSFGNGSILSDSVRFPHPVRLVRGAAPAKSYVISIGGTEVTDQETGLVWRRCLEGMSFGGVSCTGTATPFTHEAALLQFAVGPSALRFWRLPNIKELSSIADRRLQNRALDPTVFPDFLSPVVWSSTPYVSAPGNAEVIGFGDGGVTYFFRTDTAFVRLVRDGP